MKPEWDLREIVGIVAKEKANFGELNKYISKGLTLPQAKKAVARDIKISEFFNQFGIKMVNMPAKSLKMLNTEVQQKLYTSIMGSNPSHFRGENNPVEMVSWYDAIYFCNKLSEKVGFIPVYSVNGSTKTKSWGYTPHNGNSIRGEVTQNTRVNGFRLPTEEEWAYAEKGGQGYTYSGSNDLDEVGWYADNSGDRTHPVAQKKSNGYGLYDMSGNVWEWCWDVDPYNSDYRYNRGGSYYNLDYCCKVSYGGKDRVGSRYKELGFRIVCSTSN
ncbi:MAG: SUMF1/EgtB/PvdO family nonheme iron enzyme [Treponema sp.]|nr:SUMF1/EgtB/PvdO family nonheme iron enzyme [Treponema sp.]